MNKCENCNKKFSTYHKVNGKVKNLSRRKYCLDCLPLCSGKFSKVFQNETHKLCTKCNTVKPKQDFYTRGARKSCFTYCKKCQNRMRNELASNLAIDRKIKLINMKGGKCQNCGYSKNYSALEFHHIDPSTKSFDMIKKVMEKEKWERLLLESKKCTILCSNCHRELHHPQCIL